MLHATRYRVDCASRDQVRQARAEATTAHRHAVCAVRVLLLRAAVIVAVVTACRAGPAASTIAPRLRTIYVRVGLPVALDVVPPREYTTLADRLTLEGSTEAGMAQSWTLVRRIDLDPATGRALPVQLDTLVRMGQYVRRGDTLTVTVAQSPAASVAAAAAPQSVSCSPTRFEAFVVLADGAVLRTVASGPACGLAILRIHTYQRTTTTP